MILLSQPQACYSTHGSYKQDQYQLLMIEIFDAKYANT
jgi:hypothetical protein